MEKLLGVVMCGGQSQRMGTDKGLIPQGNATWAKLTYNKLNALNVPVVISINPSQIQNYAAIFNADDLVIDNQNIHGPLNGILSVHASYPDKDILILACDMVNMDSDTLQQLIDTYRIDPNHDFYAYHNNQFFEPLCAIYTSKAVSQLKQTDLSSYSLQKVLNNGDTKDLQVANPSAFKNQNRRE
jgi:molybdopterin-guanine dinucleotide biosynthesis protein A